VAIFISFIYFHIELNNRYNQIRKSVKMGYKGHYNAYMKPTIVQCQFDNMGLFWTLVTARHDDDLSQK